MSAKHPVRVLLQGLVAAAVVVSTLAVPAAAAGPVLTVATPGVVHIGGPVDVVGTASPHTGSLTLQAFSGHEWVNAAHGTASATGSFTLAMTAPGHATTLVLRVTRAGGTVKSRTVRVRVVTKIFSVTATTAANVASGAPVVVTGAVAPKATGTVWLQTKTLGVWHNVVSAKLATGSKLRLTATLAAGAHTLRVQKPYTSTIASGVSKTLTVTVAAPAVSTPPAAPVVTTTTLPGATVGFGYAAQLAAGGGLAPLTWAATSLPAGLSVSPTGAISGTPTTALTSTVTVTATDALGRAAGATLSLAVAGTTATAWGADDSGQLGNGDTHDSPSAVVAGLTDVTSVTGGSVNGYASLAGGTVWAWGANDQGQLGSGSTDTTDNVLSPVQVSGLTTATKVVSGRESAYALKADGTVWAWGFNGYGDLGDGSVSTSNVPVQVSGLTGVTAIRRGGRRRLRAEERRHGVGLGHQHR